MISGRITDQRDDHYRLTLDNGQALELQDKYLPESLRAVGQKVNLIFGGAEATDISEVEVRALLNNLLS